MKYTTAMRLISWTHTRGNETTSTVAFQLELLQLNISTIAFQLELLQLNISTIAFQLHSSRYCLSLCSIFIQFCFLLYQNILQY
jgi:hypothetical protein